MRNIDESPFVPHKIIKVYKRGYGREYYLEQCSVSVKDKEIVVGPGKPLSKNAVRRIAGAATDEKHDMVLKDAIMDPGILYFNPFFHKRFILWYRRQQAKKFTIRGKEYYVHFPTMLFMVAFDELRIFSMKSNTRPTLTTNVFVAPLMNLSDTTKFCWGSVKLSKDISNVDEEVRFWERKIWHSDFTHVGSKCTETELTTIYNKLNGTNTKFPKDELIDIEMTIEDLIRKYRP